jgi:hypothetical protein
MPDLPGGGYLVLTFCAFGLGLVIFFAVRELLFRFHYRRGKRLFEQQSYGVAMHHLIRAERLWMLNLSKQTFPSRAKDCQQLGTVLDLISKGSERHPSRIDTEEYRKAVAEMERFFSSTEKASKNWPLIYSNFSELRKQFRSKQKTFRQDT